MENYYVKLDSGRYKKVGTSIDVNYLPIGVYYIRNKGKSMTSIEYHRVNEDTILDVLKSVDSIELTDIITPIIDDIGDHYISSYDKAKMLAKHILNNIK
jgi:hypothetical protein